MTDTTNLDTTEKVDILIKQSFGFPSTSENKQWYEETSVKFNNYLNGEELFLDVIPNIPDFDTHGTVKTPEEVGLVSGDFMNFNSDINNKSTCSIVDDSTGTVRRYRLLILQQTPQLGDDAGSSWYKLNSSSNNVVKDAFQFNFKQYKDENNNVIQPYLYGLYTEKSTSSVLPFGRSGGNWIFEVKNGIIFFPDFINFSNEEIVPDSKFQINISDNFPVLTFYKYIGQKGINTLNTKLFDISSAVTKIIDGCYNIIESGGSDLSFAIFESSFNEYFNFNDELIIKKDVRITQNLYVDGSFTYINSSVKTIVDPIIELGADSCGNELSVNDGQDRGLKLTYYDDSLNLQKSGFIGLVNQSDSNLYNSFALYSDACFNNNTIDLCNSSLGLLNLYGLNSKIINTDKLFNNNDISLEEIKSLDNSSNYVLNFKQLNSYLDSKFFLKEDTFNNFIDYSFNNVVNDLSNIINNITDLSSNLQLDISSLYSLITDISNRSPSSDISLDSLYSDLSNIINNITDLSSNLQLDISSLYSLITDISNRSPSSDISLDSLYSDLSNIINNITDLSSNLQLDISSLYSLITDISNRSPSSDISLDSLYSDISNLKLDISNISNNIVDLNYKDLLVKSDINFNSALINFNKDSIEINKTSIIEINKNIQNLLITTYNNENNININKKSTQNNSEKIIEIIDQITDLSNVSIFNKNNIEYLTFFSNILKADINYNSSLINQNKQSIDNNIDNIEEINNKINNISNVLDNNTNNINDNSLDISNILQSINNISNVVDNNTNNINDNSLDISNILQSINNISNVVDNNTDNINDNSLDISNILQSILENLNLIYGLSGQIENLSGLSNNNKNNIEYLTAFNNILKADINYNSSIINKNSQDINLLKTNAKLNKETINDNITDINSINDLINNVLNNIKFLSQQDNLLKADLNYNSSLIKYNSVDNNLLKDKVNNLENTLNNAYYLLNNKFSELEKKLQNAFDFI